MSFVPASDIESSQITATIQRTARVYTSRDPDVAPLIGPSVHAVLEADRQIAAAAKIYQADRLQAERDKRINASMAVLDNEDGAIAAAATAHAEHEDRATRLVPVEGGGFVERNPKRELSSDERDRRMALWAWFDRMPADQRVREYFAAIANDDHEAIEAIEALPRAMNFVTPAIEEQARTRKLQRIPASVADSIESKRRQLQARMAVADQARRLLRELAGQR